MIDSTAEAIAVLQDAKLPESERTKAIHFLRDHPSNEGIDALVAALGDDDFGVRWAAGSALAAQGQAALEPILRKLLTSAGDLAAREAAAHALHDSISPEVRAKTADLQDALKRRQTDVAVLTETSKLLQQLHS